MNGLIKILLFLLLLMAAAWGVNIYRHVRAGGWKGFIAAVDVVGALMLAAAFIAVLIPIIK